MAIRTVRLDDEAEAALRQIRQATGLPISAALKRGLHELQRRLSLESASTPYDIYRQIALGPGGYAIAPSTAVKAAVHRAIRQKLQR